MMLDTEGDLELHEERVDTPVLRRVPVPSHNPPALDGNRQNGRRSVSGKVAEVRTSR